MATEIPYVARYTVSTAQNADLNATPDAAFDIIFTSVNPDGLGVPGDLFLDNFLLDGQQDSNTWVSLDGGISWETFDVLFTA